ncbi:MazG nucleotide pyrophosphohydrolase domain-containing protein [Litchfieldia salsa]|uniref:MazG nucleotide pyrophosphohydrolase domain-containing protein n=1 Tax=Litchfieldia salsa TaxID=930152 RepID=A0A1H0RSN6_9BACI|nr:MazG nucleotide pyrophosphohydrolase domain-containing protein [Litchfieldia salsa]SDP32571.1 MazG nucleotide pyrophosphohydrolase domain-containing protein [Litchfieldia salsa]
MKEVQEFLKVYQKEMNWEISNENYEEAKTSLLHNYMLLTTEVSEIAEEIRSIINETRISHPEDIEFAFKEAKDKHKENIGNEIADCFAYLIKFANYFEIDLEESFYSKMKEVQLRKNKDV